VTSLLAIDPGYAKRGPGCACAMFVDHRLTSLWYERPSGPRPFPAWPAAVVWELPEVRPREDVSPSKANTLVRLAAEGALLAGLYAAARGAEVRAATPAEWKGSKAKPVHHGRVLAELDEAELDVVVDVCGADTVERVQAAKRAGGLDRWAKAGAAYYGRWDGHNALDAVGLGLWQLQRLPR
jgi:hypothetical protein